MCMSSQQPEPDINKPNYTPSEMDKNFTLSMKPKGGPKTVFQRQDKDANSSSSNSEEGSGSVLLPPFRNGGGIKI